ncbi:MAG: PIN domain nuclease [Gordonia sp. (in: high G+C Gram-positive bacteria)]|uniref:type II toxin-antitoxin system VapC family toxin n=1 Tax=Gordonia sp. (in: high G+C Gram-positive bacteria) TaxID=84139 RepID=UPI0039E5F6C4
MEHRVILVDTSAWVEYLRDTDDPVVGELKSLIQAGAELATSEPIIMELLAGADTPLRDAAITRLTNGLPLLSVDTALDYRAAAQLFVASRAAGHRIRSLNDCLIAAIAVRHGVPLLHRDRDFAYLAQVTPLRLHTVGVQRPPAASRSTAAAARAT